VQDNQSTIQFQAVAVLSLFFIVISCTIHYIVCSSSVVRIRPWWRALLTSVHKTSV